MPLAEAKIRNIKPRGKPQRVSDFEGLSVLVRPKGSRLRHQTYRIVGKVNLLAIGPCPEVSLIQARQGNSAFVLVVKPWARLGGDDNQRLLPGIE